MYTVFSHEKQVAVLGSLSARSPDLANLCGRMAQDIPANGGQADQLFRLLLLETSAITIQLLPGTTNNNLLTKRTHQKTIY